LLIEINGANALGGNALVITGGSSNVQGLIINRFSGTNVHSIVLEIPISRVTYDGQSVEQTKAPVIGMYASTSRQKVNVLKENGGAKDRGSWVQVSRLANPLVNELIIDTPVKDRWNAAEPEDEGQFQEFYKNP